MIELAPCSQCKRHVAIDDLACPFCNAHVASRTPLRVMLRGHVARAVVFSAALGACESKQTAPKPAPVEHAGSGSDDLEKMLDVGQRPVDRSAAGNAAIVDASVADAAMADAAAPVDAAVPIDAGVKRRPRPDAAVPVAKDRAYNAKPYGAPPARRRVV